jgi:hypothetical protein
MASRPFQLLPLYLRHEPTTDRVVIERDPEMAKRCLDVVAYRDPEMTTVAARWAWWQTRPRRNAKSVTFNCYRWRAVWAAE